MMVLGLIQRVIVFKTDIFSAENYPYFYPYKILTT